jgi:Cof subfamily protein (haloacid dehalogenase superfamily)
VAPPGPIRLFVSDVDGTLVRHDKSLSDGNVAAARRLVAAGVAMSLISARPPGGMLWIAEKIGLPGPFAAFNGGTLFDADGTIRSAARLDDALAAECLRLIGERCETWLFTRGQWYAHSGKGTHPDRERLAAGLEPSVRSDFSGLVSQIDKLVAVTDDSALLDTIEREAKARFGGEANIVRSQAYYLDFTAPAANKGDGLAALATAEGVPLSEVAVAGDMDNDLPMFARAAHSYAMGQASARVREAASEVSATNDEDGVAVAIDRLLSGRGVSSGAPIR